MTDHASDHAVDPAPVTGPSGPFDPPGCAGRVCRAARHSTAPDGGHLVADPVRPGVVLALAFDVVWLWSIPAVALVIGIWCAAVVPRQVRAIGYAERDDDLLIRKGVMFRSLVVVPYGRMQYVDVQAGPLARRFRIAQVQLHTASPATDASIDGLEPAEAERLRDRLASRGEARLAGL
ncbi:PH domain-containing protein [Oerskovia sp. M15]